jgi:pSer/pThr/pTyr-binding forkhead associated (FHA) protein
MPLRLTAYLPDGCAVDHLLETAATLGRGGDCEVVLDDPSVSRRHARLSPNGSHWRLEDLGSKNGSFVDACRIEQTDLAASTWVRFGEVLCELRLLDELSARRLAAEPQRRRQLSTLHAGRLEAAQALPELLESTLAAVVELAGARRGLLLVPEDGQLLHWSRAGLQPLGAGGREFDGSLGVVQRVLGSGQPVVLNEVQGHAFGERASVLSNQLRCLVCLPLLDAGEVLALFYADSRMPGEPVTREDLALLRALVERAAVWIAADRNRNRLETAGAGLAGALREVAAP